MVRISTPPEYNHVEKTAKVSLFADAKTDVVSGMTVEGLLSGYELAAGSSCMTAAKEFGYLNSSGVWVW